jgi:hypothetical protein
MAKFLTEFEDFPAEREAIGNMLIGYGEIEFAILSCLSEVNGDLETSARILFRVRGETPRIEVADAIMRPVFSGVGLGPKWGNAVGAIRICKNIRNQYAHCHWHQEDKQLKFMDLDADAKSTEGDVEITYRFVDSGLIQKQTAYFSYALDWLYFLAAEYKRRAGRPVDRVPPEPKSIAAPPLYNPTG